MKKPPPPEHQFKPGHPKTGGRTRGSRDKLSNAFIEALAEQWEIHKEDVLRIVIAEEPATFMKLIASLVPKELEIKDVRPLSELTDEQLDALISIARNARIAPAIPAGIGDGEDETKSRH